MSETIRTRALALKTLTEEQAEDEGLWFIAETAAETYLQQELRRLTALVEVAADATLADLNNAQRGSRTRDFEKWNLNHDFVILHDPQSANPGGNGASTSAQGVSTDVAPSPARIGAPDPPLVQAAPATEPHFGPTGLLTGKASQSRALQGDATHALDDEAAPATDTNDA